MGVLPPLKEVVEVVDNSFVFGYDQHDYKNEWNPNPREHCKEFTRTPQKWPVTTAAAPNNNCCINPKRFFSCLLPTTHPTCPVSQ